jgi:hypothetical protein
MGCVSALGKLIRARDTNRQTADIHIALPSRVSARSTVEVLRVI